MHVMLSIARKLLLAGILCLLLPLYTFGQENSKTTRETNRPAFSSTMFSAGRTHLHDDYLSVNNYEGFELGIIYERMRVLPFGNGKWIMRHRFDTNAAKANSLSGSRLFSAMLSYGYGQLYTLHFPCGLVFRTGGELSFLGGALYNPGNSNNPTAVKAQLMLGFSEMLTYTIQLKRRPITIRYQLSLPCMGMFFSPAYGESFYEIFYLGNHNGIIQFGSWHNIFDMNNLITVDIPVGRTALRLGYENRIHTCRSDHRKYFHYTNNFIIGISTSISQIARSARKVQLSSFY